MGGADEAPCHGARSGAQAAPQRLLLLSGLGRQGEASDGTRAPFTRVLLVVTFGTVQGSGVLFVFK